MVAVQALDSKLLIVVIWKEAGCDETARCVSNV